MQSDSSTRVLQDIGRIVRDARVGLRWTQHDLERRTGLTQSRISRIERGTCRSVRVTEVDCLFVGLGVRYELGARIPRPLGFVRDAVHARCATYVQRRLERAGWMVRREVEIGRDGARGWIDILAFHPVTRLLLVIEIRTELHDIGAIERSLNWYVGAATRAAAAIGWRPARVSSALLLLATRATDEAIRSNRAAMEIAFPGRWAMLRTAMEGDDGGLRRSVTMIDPRSRRRLWLVPTVLEGRRSAAPYADYIDAVRLLERSRR